MTGQIISGRYRIDAELGAGGMGTVYRGHDTQTQQSVAIKQLKPELVQPELIERFVREGEALRDLNHPNIVKMLDTFEHEGKHFLVIEYVSGGDLSELLMEQGQLDTQHCLNLAIDLADALTRAHRLNIIHRDLKPANVLIGEDGTLRLTDFGVAHVGDSQRITDTDAIIGTVDYLPPEVFEGNVFDVRGDVWAFGVMLFEMLAGERPFPGNNLMEVIHAITTYPIPDLEDLAPDTPIALIDVVYRMLERDPEARISSVRHVGAALEDILQGRDSQIQIPRFDVTESDIFAIKKHNLPAQTTPFVGRAHELEELSKLIADPDIRLMTIIAPGGMGKTRLSLEAAERSIEQFEDGVYFVELAPLSSADQIVSAIAAAIEFQLQSGAGDAMQELVELLQPRNMLLVMDNFEHVLEGAIQVAEILAKTKNIQILATSRQRLAQRGETILHLGGMDFSTAQTPEEALNYAAIKLFLNSAKRANPNFDLTAENLDAVAQICTLVQGMPLGIVLAGAWLEMLSPTEIADELAQSIDILSDEIGELPERQQSIRAVMDYSWQQMNAKEQSVFMKLSIFKGGFTREAAGDVTDANLRVLMSLVTKSLLRRDADTGRYQIHELLRQYAYEQLENANELEDALEQHAIHYSNFLVQQLPLLKGGGQTKALADIDHDYENCHAAWLWVVVNQKADLIDRMIDPLYWYVQLNYQYDMGYSLFDYARQQWSLSDDAPSIAGRLRARFIGTEDPEIVQPLLEKCLALAEQYNQASEIAFCQRELGRLFGHHINGDRDAILRGIDYLKMGLSLYQKIGDAYLEALTLDDIGYAYHRIGDFAKRVEYSGRSLELRKKVGDFMGYGDCLNGYTSSLFPDGLDKPIKLLEEGRELAYQTNNSYLLGMLSPLIGLTYMFRGRFEEAFDAYQTSYQLSLASKNERWRVSSLLNMVFALCIMDKDMELAEQYLQDVPPDSSLIYKESFVAASRMYGMIYYTAKTGDDDMLFKELQWLTMVWIRLLGLLFQAMVHAPIFALWLGRNGNPERAVQWLAYCENHTETTGFPIFTMNWSVIVDFRKALRTDFGDEKFDALWQTGKTLDEETMLAQILEVFAKE